MLHQPRLVILDEPTNGLDPAGVVDVRATIRDLAREGATVFLSSHVLTEVEQLCDQVAVLAHGRIVASGPPAGLLGGPGSLRIRFDTAEETAAAREAMAADEIAVAPPDAADGTVLLLALPAATGSRIARRLAAVGLFPAEMTPIRPTLESVFLELTRDDNPTAGPDAAADAAADDQGPAR
jgi:ABC-2 type transport system ATP-binding protein